MTAPTLIIAWTMIQLMMPAVAMRTKKSELRMTRR